MSLILTPDILTELVRRRPEGQGVRGRAQREHYEHYKFLFTLSDRVAHFGLEHHQSNDSRVAERALIDEALGRLALGVLPHEYVHSWNGKYRRPTGLATPNFTTPMHGEMLWVYEGLTQYYGNVLAARSGLWTPEQYVDTLAQAAAGLDHTPGRLAAADRHDCRSTAPLHRATGVERRAARHRFLQ